MITSVSNIGRRQKSARRISAAAPKLRRELAQVMDRSVSFARRPITARYDSVGETDEYSEFWANADRLSADSANSRAVRHTAVSRQRYNEGSDGFTRGIIKTHANYAVGKGPTLRMQTGSQGFNRWVEREWNTWAKLIQFRRKLSCMAQAKPRDGESFGLLRINRGLPGRLKLDIQLIETEQCQTPMLPYSTVGYIDGMKFDSFGNVEHYDVLKEHPGSQWGWANAVTTSDVDQVPAKYVLHWFSMDRPGEHRGMPEMNASLNVAASSRRVRESTTSAYENIASMGAAVLTNAFPVDPADEPSPGSSVPFNRRMVTQMPNGQDLKQIEAHIPNAEYGKFIRTQISEQARPLSMPHNVAAADSSDHNFASGRLDFIAWYMELNVARYDCEDCVLDKIFAVWYSEAAREFGWFGDPDSPPAHTWDWPPHPVADQEADVDAKARRLETGQTTFTDVYAEDGRDFEDVLPVLANERFGTDEENKEAGRPQYDSQAKRNIAMREVLGNVTYNSRGQQASILQVENNSQGGGDSPARQERKRQKSADKAGTTAKV